MAKRGAKVLAAARRMPELQAVVKRCKELGSPDSTAVRLDLLDTDSHNGLVQELLAQHGNIDILVNNAGRSQRALVQDTDLQVDIGMLALNVTGVISITKALLPHFLSRGAGQILTTSSVAGKVGSTISASYSASKHAVQGFFNALRSEVGAAGISVHLACPGPVATPIQENAFSTSVEAKVDTSAPDTTKRMTAERCAHLMAVQLHNRLYEAWMAPQPILLFTTLGQYLPSLFTTLQVGWYGPTRIKAFKSGDMGYSAVNSTGGVLAGIIGAFAGSKAKQE